MFATVTVKNTINNIMNVINKRSGVSFDVKKVSDSE
jgi:hypothetical protein